MQSCNNNRDAWWEQKENGSNIDCGLFLYFINVSNDESFCMTWNRNGIPILYGISPL